jgi:molecular chaperone DnaK (HSP70)
MLGGDNMDAALARRVEQKLQKKLSAGQWTQLLQGARAAKEALLSNGAPASQQLAVASEGAKLIAGTLSAMLTCDEVEQQVVDGFFPRTGLDELPQKTSRVALVELGLPYAADPAITRHLAAFLSAHAAAPDGAARERPLRPDAILLNGGVFNSPRLSAALVDAVSSWWPQAPRIPVLGHDSLDLAVARGAAYYGLARRGLGRRIGGGAARAYYVAVAAEEPGAPRGLPDSPGVRGGTDRRAQGARALAHLGSPGTVRAVLHQRRSRRCAGKRRRSRRHETPAAHSHGAQVV